ncbi:hypothetical protein BBW65_05980 [Helicobacter enhydrae]|uniref:Cysteine desulfurase n=1 Tax=Helicobacter enhydrae TaxID=222136 RepID=A0A1B1U6F6_9HELI|nr:hypothetical protein [Helicobacter enhydrae]ANV98373.1 hypothetical protein BBW65_05980 [Helicobacter enhydrae]
MKLDFLQNPPISTELNAFLLQRQTCNLPPIQQNLFKEEQECLSRLSNLFGGDSGGNFGFGSGDFLELLFALKAQNLNIAFAISNHQQAYYAYQNFKQFFPITPIIPSQQQGIIEALPTDCDVFILPLINQDLLTLNPIQQLKAEVLQSNPNALFIIDISEYLVFESYQALKLDAHTIFLCNAENLGFLRGNGVFLSHNKHTSLFPPTRYTQGFYSALYAKILSQTPPPNQNAECFLFLQQLLTEVGLFAPLHSCFTNSLPLRLPNIKARTLIQSLFLEHISAINGQQCLFGFSQPSFVLQEMGYTQTQSRELLSLSFEHLHLESIQKLAEAYTQIRILEV